VKVRDAAARRVRRTFVHDGAPQGRASRANDLRDRAAKIVRANVVDATQVAEQFLAGGSRVRRGDADNRASGDHEHHGKIRERGDAASHHLLNGLECDAGDSGRDRTRRSNPLIHGYTSAPGREGHAVHASDMRVGRAGYTASMSTTTQPEVWMRGPIEGVDPMLMPVAHALIQVREDLEELVSSIPAGQVWQRPGGAASIGFHVRHLGGALDRLFTYARGERLSDAQKAAFQTEGEPGEPPARLEDLVHEAQAQIDRALEQLRRTNRDHVLDFRGVGRQQLPSNVLGLLFHAAEHSTRHAGQLITTAKILAAR